jgi:hydrogenase expression/formation protein HypD
LKLVDEFRDSRIAKQLAKRLQERNIHPVNLMEVCGTHTVAIFKHGIRQILPQNVKLISGPGCPVCVTPNDDIDKAIALTRDKSVILTTFGDMMKVPGSNTSFQHVKAMGADIRVVYSVLNALKIAEDNPARKVVFFGVGFETTTPTIAAAILEAERRQMDNFFLICAHKLVPPAMRALLNSDDVKIDGFICPGHVSAIIGSRPYEFIAAEYGIPCVIAGFEPIDIMQAIDMILDQLAGGKSQIEIQYRRAVSTEGNVVALSYLNRVFEVTDAYWRGIGVIPETGLKLRPEYKRFNAEDVFEIKLGRRPKTDRCQCGDILRGILDPPSCSFFGKTCTPEHPVGPCMVSSEGSCSAWYHYGPGTNGFGFQENDGK